MNLEISLYTCSSSERSFLPLDSVISAIQVISDSLRPLGHYLPNFKFFRHNPDFHFIDFNIPSSKVTTQDQDPSFHDLLINLIQAKVITTVPWVSKISDQLSALNSVTDLLSELKASLLKACASCCTVKSAFQVLEEHFDLRKSAIQFSSFRFAAFDSGQTLEVEVITKDLQDSDNQGRFFSEVVHTGTFFQKNQLAVQVRLSFPSKRKTYEAYYTYAVEQGRIKGKIEESKKCLGWSYRLVVLPYTNIANWQCSEETLKFFVPANHLLSHITVGFEQLWKS